MCGGGGRHTFQDKQKEIKRSCCECRVLKRTILCDTYYKTIITINYII